VIRAVFDTGVVVSALLFRSGAVARLRAHWRAEEVEALVCRTAATPTIRSSSSSPSRVAPKSW